MSGARGPGARAAAIAIAILVASIGGVALTQPRLASLTKRVKESEDVYVLPPPAQLDVMTLGYRAAAVDLLWAKLLVEYGTHWHDHRAFTSLTLYLDALVALEPDFAPVYRYLDTMLVYRPPRGTADDARLARAYLERGIAARPNDAKVWMQYGQFLAFTAPSFLEAAEEKERWRVDGANAMMRAVELGGTSDRAVSAATILSKSGEATTAIRTLRRLYALASTPEDREEFANKLRQLGANAEREAAIRDFQFVESQWQHDLPFVSRGEELLLGPAVDPLRCAGAGRSAPAQGDSANAAPTDCARSWGPRMPSASAEPE